MGLAGKSWPVGVWPVYSVSVRPPSASPPNLWTALDVRAVRAEQIGVLGGTDPSRQASPYAGGLISMAFVLQEHYDVVFVELHGEHLPTPHWGPLDSSGC